MKIIQKLNSRQFKKVGGFFYAMKSLLTLLITVIIFGSAVSYADIFILRKNDGSIVITNIYTPEIRNLKPVKIIKTLTRNRYHKPGKTIKINYKLENLIKKIAKKYNIDYHLLTSIAKVESNFNHNVRSSKGAIGLMQLMPQTAKRFGINNPYDLKQNIKGAARYLKYLLKLFHNNVILATAAYNAGEGVVLKYKGIPPYKETRKYVKQVMNFYKRYKFNEKNL